MFDIHVGLEKDSFRQNGDMLCARNLTAGASNNLWVPCVQAVEGQYVTIQNLKHRAYDAFKTDYSECMVLCEVKVIVNGNYQEKYAYTYHIFYIQIYLFSVFLSYIHVIILIKVRWHSLRLIAQKKLSGKCNPLPEHYLNIYVYVFTVLFRYTH